MLPPPDLPCCPSNLSASPIPPPRCSWLYWQVAGKGGDYLHGYVGAWAWTTGDIDHMDSAGTRVSQSTYIFPNPFPWTPAPTKSALPGDIVFYGRPHKHVFMYISCNLFILDWLSRILTVGWLEPDISIASKFWRKLRFIFRCLKFRFWKILINVISGSYFQIRLFSIKLIKKKKLVDFYNYLLWCNFERNDNFALVHSSIPNKHNWIPTKLIIQKNQ